MLPRVEDLEHSVQWTSLANDIDRLERLHRQGRLRRFHKPEPIEKHAYQRASLPEMQRASTVKCDDNCDTLARRNLTADYSELGGSRWSWKPRTDFEREYFYKDYKDYYCADPAFYEPPKQACRDRECYSREQRGYPQEARRPSESPAGRPSGRYSSGLDKEHFSDSRERLHEIFEHNRYLRRQFFASATGNTRQDCAGFPRQLGKGNQEAARRCNGFGSTETLTSQSNQSSVSSINDRKFRWGQARTSPEVEEEEEDALAAPAGRNNDSGQGDSKVLVNILSGNKVRHVDVRNAPVNVPVSQVNNERDDEVCDKAATEESWCRERSLPEYIFGESIAKIDLKPRSNLGKAPGIYDRNGRAADDDWSNANDQPIGDFRRLIRDTHRYAPICNETRSLAISQDTRLDSISTNVSQTNASVDRETRRDHSRSLPNLTITKRNLDAPLYVARAVNVPEEPVRSAELPSHHEVDAHITRTNLDLEQRRQERSGQREKETKGLTRSINRGQSISEETDELVPPKRLTPRRVKGLPRVPPPPLNLTMVNEQCELMEAAEGKCINDYRVDVAILRKQEDLVRDLLTIVGHDQDIVDKNNASSEIEDEGARVGEACGRSDGKRKIAAVKALHKSCGDFSLAAELQSPQLVNNCASSTCDLRTVDPAVRIARRPIDPDATRHDRASSPLFDQTGPIGGLHAGSALPSVYGPIPYSQ